MAGPFWTSRPQAAGEYRRGDRRFADLEQEARPPMVGSAILDALINRAPANETPQLAGEQAEAGRF
jgi:hypothetical protein